MSSSLVFSAVQPTGVLHLGNYLGALRQFASLQERHACVYCVADLHALTADHDPKRLRDHTLFVAAAFLACGIDPKRHIIFAQSAVGAHAELAWILNCTARMGWLERMTQFKEKAGKSRERASVGLYAYPVLMAADILAYRATHVPVGEDQKQHLELAREIARKFNNDFAGGAEFFPLPEPCIEDEAARVMSLRDASRKMSKSDPSDMSRILLTDDAAAIAQKIRRATTDPHPLPSSAAELETRPEAANLLGLLAAFSGRDMAALLSEWGGQGFRDLKEALTERLIEGLSPVRERLLGAMEARAQLEALLEEGAKRAEALSAPILEETKRAVGLLI